MQKIPFLLTRPEGSNADYAAGLPERLSTRLRPIDCPLIRIVPIDAPATLAPEDAAIFTSSNAVEHAPAAEGRRAFCVGSRTTQAASDAGWDAVFAGPDARALIACLLASLPAMPLCHLSGAHVRVDIVGALMAEGLQARRLVVYDQPLLPLSAEAVQELASGAYVIVPLFSPRAAAHFARIAPPGANTCLVALSPAVADAAALKGHFDGVVAEEPTAQSLGAALEKLVDGICLG